MRTCPNLLILTDSFPVTGLCDQEDFQAKFPRKSVFPKTFDRRRQFQPKFGPPTKKWHKLSDESEIAELSNRPPFFSGKPKPGGFGGKAGPIASPLR
jgi:hypothetical protein